ncbi:MAG: hypothetical protein U5L11_05600 [Arhodomonas sp.]|nr:hypothetical protein [Arhodomonas sp.]
MITGISRLAASRTVAFDILFNEGQRRYLESLNAYARQFVQPASRPDVDAIYGIPPTVAIEQRTSRGGRKSTVATMTEIHHFLRLLFVKLGTQYCPDCDVPIRAAEPRGHPAAAAARAPRPRHPTCWRRWSSRARAIYNELAHWAAGKGYERLRVDGEDRARPPTGRGWTATSEHDIDLPVDASSPRARNENGPARGPARRGAGATATAPLAWSMTAPGDACSPRGAPARLRRELRRAWTRGCSPTTPSTAGARAATAPARSCPASTRSRPARSPPGWTSESKASRKPCPDCNGQRLNPVALAVRFREQSIADISAAAVRRRGERVSASWKLDERGAAHRPGHPAASCTTACASCRRSGLDYLTLDRAAPTLSGGEAQRIRLAAQLGSNLQGVCYILDEPTIGLHPRDNRMLLDTLARLEGKGNTIVVVEHDEETIRRAEHVIDLGPGAGVHGGRVVAAGTPGELLANPDSVTGRCLANPLHHPLASHRRDSTGAEALRIVGAHRHNLHYVDARIPLSRLTVVTGVSGSGKSTLVRDVLLPQPAPPASAERRRRSAEALGGCQTVEGWAAVGRVLEVDQTPIGKTPRSCPATYVGIWDDIRRLFAQTEEARIRGYGPGRFSFNTPGGPLRGL